MTRYGVKGGWYGNPSGHAMAAKGIRLYASKPKLHNPIFYAQKSETLLPFAVIMDSIRKGKSYQQIKTEYPSSDSEEIRMKGIKAIETMDGNSTLSQLDRNGVDQSVSMAKKNEKLKLAMEQVLADNQKSSFLHPVKVSALKDGLRGKNE